MSGRSWLGRLGMATMAVALTMGVGVGVAGVAGAQDEPDDERGRVVIVSLPTMRWEDVVEHRPEAILDVVGRSAIASNSVRTVGPFTTPGEAYVTMGAGNRATVTNEEAGLAYDASSPQEFGTAGEVYERRTDESIDGAAVVQVGIASVQRSASSLNYGAEPGALAGALADAGMTTAVVANADLPNEDHREAALAVMDPEGRVAGGTVSRELLAPNNAAAFGTQMDLQAASVAALGALRDHQVVLVEASDLARVDGYWPLMTPRAAREARARAIEAADRLVADLMGALDLERDTLMLVGPTSPSNERTQLTVFAMAGPDVEPGLARSGTTRRAGYVTLTDIAPTVLDRLDVDLPDEMNGTVITSSGGGTPSDSDLESMVDVNELTVFRDRAVGPASITYIVLQVVAYVVAIVALAWRGRPPWLPMVALGGTLWVLAVPPLTFLSGLVRYDALGLGGYVVALLGTSGLVALVAWLLFRRNLLGPPLALVGLMLLVLVGDVVTGGNLQINTVFGYSPVVAGRFAGFGNLAFGLLAMSAVVFATGLWAAARLQGPSGEVRPVGSPRGWAWWTAAALFLVVLATDGAPDWGSDVGGVLAGVPAYGAVLLVLAGIRIGWRRAVALGAVSVLVLAAFAAVDLARPEEQQTHLARFVRTSSEGGGGTIIERKLQANVGILTSTVWAWLVPIGLAFIIFLIWRDRGTMAALQRRVPGLRAFFVGGVIVAVLGMGVNDSGVAVPAVMCGVALPYLTYVVISTERREQCPEEDGLSDEHEASDGADQGSASAAGAVAERPVV